MVHPPADTGRNEDERGGGGVDVFVFNACVHVLVPEVGFFTAVVAVVAIMRPMYDGGYIDVRSRDVEIRV